MNCCKDVDYGVHIKEDSQNHELVGLTPAGKYHITMLDLNADHLVKERKDRADFLRELDSPLIIKNGKDISDLKTLFDKLKQQIDEMIPTIPYV